MAPQYEHINGVTQRYRLPKSLRSLERAPVCSAVHGRARRCTGVLGGARVCTGVHGRFVIEDLDQKKAKKKFQNCFSKASNLVHKTAEADSKKINGISKTGISKNWGVLGRARA